MNFLGFCLFIIWMLFVVAVGVAFLVWGWQRGDFQIATGRTDQKPENSETDAARQGTSINCSGQAIAFES
jgi:hypothetical protein